MGIQASSTQIINMSLSTAAANPDEVYRVNEEELQQTRIEALREFNIEICGPST